MGSTDNLGCVVISTDNRVRASPISAESFKSIQAVANQNPSMEWSISPRKAAYAFVAGSSRDLDIGVIGSVQLRYNQQLFTLRRVFFHKPLPFAQTIQNIPVAEVSCIFINDSAKQTIRWIFPVFQSADSSVANKALVSWLTTAADQKPLVNSFEDFLPSDFSYVQWMDCFTVLQNSRSQTNSVIHCYCLKPLFIPTTLSIPTPFDYFGSSAPAVSWLEPYIYRADPSSYSDADTTARFAIWRIITGKRRVEAARSRTTKCYALNLSRDIDSRGMVNLDEKGAPLDPVTVQELAGRNPELGIQDEALKAVQAQRSTINTILFWVFTSILIILAVILALYILLNLFRGSAATSETMKNMATNTGLNAAAKQVDELRQQLGIPGTAPTVPILGQSRSANAK